MLKDKIYIIETYKVITVKSTIKLLVFYLKQTKLGNSCFIIIILHEYFFSTKILL